MRHTLREARELLGARLGELGFSVSENGHRFEQTLNGGRWFVSVVPFPGIHNMTLPYLEACIQKPVIGMGFGYDKWHLCMYDPVESMYEHLRSVDFPVDAKLRVRRLRALID